MDACCCACDDAGVESVNERRTSGDSSASTVSVRCAVLARCAVGKGMVRVLAVGLG